MRVLCYLGLALIVALGAVAQEGVDEVVGGGFMTALFFLDFATLNEGLTARGFAPFSGPVFLWGGGGFGGARRDLRLGGFGFGGETGARSPEKAALLELGFGGMSLEIGFWSDAHASLSAGVLLGGGGAELRLSHRRPSSFDDALQNPVGSVFTRSFFAFQPFVSVEFYLLDWIFLKAQLGYMLALGEPWEAAGVPTGELPLSLSAPLFQLLVVFGGLVSAD